MSPTPPEVSAALFKQQLEYLVEAADETRGDVRALGAAINGTSGLAQRIASVEQTHRDCEARARIGGVEDLCERNARDISAIKAGQRWMWVVVGISMVTLTTALFVWLAKVGGGVVVTATGG